VITEGDETESDVLWRDLGLLSHFVADAVNGGFGSVDVGRLAASGVLHENDIPEGDDERSMYMISTSTHSFASLASESAPVPLGPSDPS